jgi:sn-glycerol 3-phosphate transport system ATP-binding protein
MTTIRFERVEKRFGTVTVLSALDLEIRTGEFFTFLGPSGCGKSTLLSLIAGIETPDAGGIWFGDQRVNALEPGERDVAMVFQSYALYPHMTVYENLAFPLTNRRLPRAQIDAAVRRTAAQLGIEALLGRKPKALSGGQRQRVALGRALVRKPRVFLLDEPLSNLDARLRLDMREELKRLHAELGITTVYVTHDQEEAMALSDRIALLNEGRVQQCATPAEIYGRPANLFVASFIGSPPMNLLDGARCAGLGVVRERLAPLRAEDVTVGVRPTDVRVSTTPAANAIEAEALLVEPTGADLWVVGAWRDQRIKGRAEPGEHVVAGQRVYLAIPGERLYLFDRESGESMPGDSGR